MAFLIPAPENTEHNTVCYLNEHHVFGRMATGIDTFFSDPIISRIHAVIEWSDEQWLLKDVSSNGTWLNNRKVNKNKTYPLKKNDRIAFANSPLNAFSVQDLAPPQNILCPVEPHGLTENDYIVLTENNIFPLNKPEISIFYAEAKQQWYIEYFSDTNGEIFPVNHLDTIRFNNHLWQIRLTQNCFATRKINKPALTRSELHFRFVVSQDEENTQLYINTPDQECNLSNNDHHYLTLYLARKKAEDANKGIEPDQQGWVLRALVAQEFQVEPSHLNTQICRVKDQFMNVLEGACKREDIIEKQGRYIRFSGQFYSVYKGGKLETSQGFENLSLAVLNG